MPNYRSNTSTTDPRAAAAPNAIPPSDAGTLRAMWQDGMARLQTFAPQNPEAARGKERLIGMGGQIDLNIEAAESNPFALQGLAQEVYGWRRSVFALIGDYGTINGQALSGLGTTSGLGVTGPSAWKWALVIGGTVAVGLGFWWLISRKGSQGGGLGSVHDSELKLHNTRVPTAKPSK